MSWIFSSPDRGRHIFADVLARYAAQTCDGRLGAVERRVRAAVRVAVTGRQGVGPSSVAAALSGAGHMITRDVDGADVHVRVIAEALKPEDEWALRDSSVPAVVVLNKADLAGADPGGPLAGAERMVARLAAELGLPVVPMVAPAIGGLLDQAFGWKSTFWVLFGFGAAVFVIVWVDLGETGTPSDRSLWGQFAEYPELLTSPRFWGYCLATAFSSGAFFAFLGGGPRPPPS